MTTHIATDSDRTAIYGLGSNASEAIADALAQFRDLTDLIALPCTQALYDHVKTRGGAISWDEQDGVACLG